MAHQSQWIGLPIFPQSSVGASSSSLRDSFQDSSGTTASLRNRFQLPSLTWRQQELANDSLHSFAHIKLGSGVGQRQISN